MFGSSPLIGRFLGDPPTSGLASGAITGIVFAVFVIVFFVLPFGWVFGKGYWEKRHESDCYNTLTNPSDWCDCDCTRTTATWHPPRRTDPPPSTTHTTITTAVTTNTAAGSSSEDSQDETSSNVSYCYLCVTDILHMYMYM